MESQSFSETLKNWLAEIVPFGNFEKYVRFGYDGDTENGTTRVRATVCTGSTTFKISATPTYLGCIAELRIALPGENWLRGSDLPDGSFSRDTWLHIKDAMLRYELVKLAPLAVPTAVQPSVKVA